MVPFKTFSQNIYFTTPTSNSVYHIPYGGSYGISYIIVRHPSIHVYDYYVKLTYPDGQQSNWQISLINNQVGTGGWWVTEGGTYQIQAKAWVKDITWGTYYWVYRQPFSFSVIADPPPPSPLSVSISGPTTAPGAVGTWTANVSGGYLPYSYQWYHMWTSGSPLSLQSKTVSNNITPQIPTDTWYPVGTNSPILNLYLNGGNSYLRVDVTDNTGTFVSDQYYVAGAGGGILSKASGNSLELIKTIPEEYSLEQNYPNPFNPSTEIKYALKKDGFITIRVYDVLGRVVATLVNENKPAGFYTVNFDASKLSSGIYFYRITANGFTAVKKMILTK